MLHSKLAPLCELKPNETTDVNSVAPAAGPLVMVTVGGGVTVQV